jgi:TRAP-type mannitol/chloroaromatic compound transport system permease small subunit
MTLLRAFTRAADWLAEWTGLTIRWLVIIIMLTMTFEVVMSYVLNSPTAWSYDTTIMMGGVFFLISAPYVLLHQGHIRIDIFYARFPEKMRHIVDIVFTVLLLFTSLGVFTQQAWKYALWSWQVHEISQFGYWEPTMVPFRFVIAIGFSLLSLEAIAWFIRELYSSITGKRLISLEGNRQNG